MYTLVGFFFLFFRCKRFRLLPVLISLLFLGCKKENKDGESPEIRIESPTTGTIFYYQNAISVKAGITDNERIESVTLEIINDANVRFLETSEFFPNEKSFDINYTITHNDLYLPGGTYYVKISATDGENESVVFREIQLMAAPRFLERVFVIRENGSATLIDTLNGINLVPCINYSAAYRFGGIDSRSQQVAICSDEPSALLTYRYPDFEPINAEFPPTNETITAFYHDKEHRCFYWGTQQGNLWRTNMNGTQLFASIANSAVLHIGAHQNYIIVETQGISNNFMNVLRNDNGLIITSLPLNWELKGMISFISETDRVLLIGNENNIAHFAWLNLNTSAFNEVFNFYETSAVQSVCDGAGNDFYVVHEGGLARYSNVLDNYILNSSLSPDKLIYDDLNQSLWAILPDEVLLLNESGTSTQQSVAAPGVQDVWLKYNK